LNAPERPVLSMADVRADFPATQRWTYADVAARGVLSLSVRAAMDAHLDERMYNGGDKARMFALVERVRGRFARLVQAHADEIAMTKNVSEGINIVAAGLPWVAGDNVVLSRELEHPNNVYPWANLSGRGVEVRNVPPRDGHMPVDDMLARIDGRTRLVTASSVTFAPGFRTDLARLGRACRERGIFFLVDGAQSIGLLRTDVEADAIDGLAVSTQKGLLGLYGMGLLYVRREWAERLAPVYLARFGVDLGEAHEATLGGEEMRLMPGARRFDLGNYNFLGCTALDAALDLQEALGSERIERHVIALAQNLAHGLVALDLPVCGADSGPQQTNIVTVGRLGNGGHDGLEDPRLNALAAQLSAHQVKFSLRRGLLRFSFHVYNDDDDVQRIVGFAREFCAV